MRRIAKNVVLVNNGKTKFQVGGLAVTFSGRWLFVFGAEL